MKHHILEGQTLDWLLASAADALLIVDGDGRIVLVNPPLERLFGYQAADLIGQTLETLIPERFRHAHVENRTNYFTRLRSRPMGVGMELRGLRRDGKEVPVEVSLSPLRTDRGLNLVMATIHDITARTQSEEALRDSEARMRAIVDAAADAIISIHESGLIERVNPFTEGMFGYASNELVGQPIAKLMPKLANGLHHDFGGLTRHDLVGHRKDGTSISVELTLSEMDVAQTRMFTAIVRDVTERKHAEEQRRLLVQEITSANEELTNFAYVVSHDLKAPLRGIGSLADWLSNDYADKFDDEGREHMRLLIGRVHRMGALIDGILQYSRVGRVKETCVAVDLNGLVRDVIDLLAPPAHINVAVVSRLPTVMAEKTRIQQVFQNLISNAIKYIDKPVGEIRIDCMQQPEHWQFSVADNGPGIEQRHFERIFQLFQTLASRDQVESTGVGLALVRKILDRFGGQVWLESTMNTGTTFFFRLPIAMFPTSNEGTA